MFSGLVNAGQLGRQRLCLAQDILDRVCSEIGG